MFLLSARESNGNQKEFTQFSIMARAASNAERSKAHLTTSNTRRVGRFQLFDDGLTEFNVDCVNTISQADDVPKTEIQVMWVAPATGSGCVAISGLVYENPRTWYADNEQLTKIICEGKPERTESDTECCACDEAKYEVCFS